MEKTKNKIMLICQGQDGCGKTHACQEIARRILHESGESYKDVKEFPEYQRQYKGSKASKEIAILFTMQNGKTILILSQGDPGKPVDEGGEMVPGGGYLSKNYYNYIEIYQPDLVIMPIRQGSANYKRGKLSAAKSYFQKYLLPKVRGLGYDVREWQKEDQKAGHRDFNFTPFMEIVEATWKEIIS